MKQQTFSYKVHSRTTLGDLHTPVSTYLKLRDMYMQSALLESSDYHGSENNRSFIAINPIASIAISHGSAIASYPNLEKTTREISSEYGVDTAINEFLGNFSVEGE